MRVCGGRVFGGLPSQGVALGDVAIREEDLPEYCGRALVHERPNTVVSVTIDYESMVGQEYQTTLRIQSGVAEIFRDLRL